MYGRVAGPLSCICARAGMFKMCRKRGVHGDRLKGQQTPTGSFWPERSLSEDLAYSWMAHNFGLDMRSIILLGSVPVRGDSFYLDGSLSREVLAFQTHPNSEGRLTCLS